MSIDIQNIHGLEGVLAALKSLPAKVNSKNGGVVDVALRKGAAVIRDQAKRNVQGILAADAAKPGDHAKSTGSLLKNIASVKDRDPQSHGASARYVVKVKKAPKVRNLTPAQYGHILEIGSEREVAKPWMTPAYYSKRQQALDTVVTELQKGIAKAIEDAATLGKSGR